MKGPVRCSSICSEEIVIGLDSILFLEEEEGVENKHAIFSNYLS